MKLSSTLAAVLSATSALALSIPTREAAPASSAEQLFTVELAPGKTKQVTEAEKWELHNVRLKNRIKFIDTDTSRLVSTSWTSRTMRTSTRLLYLWPNERLSSHQQ
jgi:leucyl aminopeptidase